MKRNIVITFICITLLLFAIPLVTAINDNRWTNTYRGGFTSTRVIDRPAPDQFNYFNNCYRDNYTTYIYTPVATTATISFGMCLNGNHPNWDEGIWLNGRHIYDRDLSGRITGAGLTRTGANENFDINLRAGVNEVFINNQGDCHEHAKCRSTFKYLEGSDTLSSQVEYMDARGRFCDPTEQCCKDNYQFEPINSPCDPLPDGNYSGVCDGIGSCINFDNDAQGCRDEIGPDAWLEGADENACCEFDEIRDCGFYNVGDDGRTKICYPGQSRWEDLRIGEITPHPCKPGQNVVQGETTLYSCLAGEAKLDHSFDMGIAYPVTDGLWNTDSTFNRRRVTIEDLDPLDPYDPLNLPYVDGTRKGIQTYFYLRNPKIVTFNVTCDSGDFNNIFIDREHLVSLGETEFGIQEHIAPELQEGTEYVCTYWPPRCAWVRTFDYLEPTGVKIRPGNIMEIQKMLDPGWHLLEIWCENDDTTDDDSVYPNAGDSLITVTPKLSTIVDAMASTKVKEDLMWRYAVTQNKIVLKDFVENLSSAMTYFPAVFAPVADPDDTATKIGMIHINSFDPNVVLSFSDDVTINYTINHGEPIRAEFIGTPPEKTDFDIIDITKDDVTHQYVCAFSVGENFKDIGECIGDGSISPPFSSFTRGGYQNRIGDAYDLYDIKEGYQGHYYCTEQLTWEYDLDNPDFKQACILAEDLGGSKLRQKPLGFGWTGTGCCSEQEDIPEPGETGETYNDPDQPGSNPNEGGACYDSEKIDNGLIGTVGLFTDNSAIVHQGIFSGCTLPADSPLFTLTDDLTQQPLVTNFPVCTVFEEVAYIPGNNYYCSYTGEWQFTPQTGERITKNKLLESTYDTQLDCCLPDECFDGRECIPNQVLDSSFTTHFDYRCIDGDWVFQEPKYNWNYGMVGFCARPEQCLVNPQGNPENNLIPETYYLNDPAQTPSCIDDTQFISDNYCSEGTWTSRTKYVALQLLDYAETYHPNDYELFCDNYENVLNFVSYKALPNALAVENYIKNSQCFDQDCVNQVCVLKYGGDKVAFGTSLNARVNDRVKSFLLALGHLPTVCNNAIHDNGGDGGFEQCGIAEGITNVWYSQALNSIIYLPEDDLNSRTPLQLLASTGHLLTGLFDELKDLVHEKEHIIQLPADFIDRTHLFDTIYVVSKDGAKYLGFVETDQVHLGLDVDPKLPISFIGLNYKPFVVTPEEGSDACKLIKDLDPTFTGICEYDPATQHLMMLRLSLTGSANPTLEAWTDLTASLRFIKNV